MASSLSAPYDMSLTNIGMSRCSGLAALGPITTPVRPIGASSSLGLAGELGGDELDVVPLRQLLARHTHRRHRAVVAEVLEPLVRQAADQADVGLGRVAVRVLVGALVGLAVVGLRVPWSTARISSASTIRSSPSTHDENFASFSALL